MKSIKFLGAAGTVTGSSFLLQRFKESGLLIDLGMFQGPKNIEQLNHDEPQFDGGMLEAVILTHAHLDHCGRLPLLLKKGFKGKIYMTQPTADLLEITLTDAVHVAQHNQEHQPLYTEDDVLNLMSHINIVDYHQDFEIGPYKITFYDAGHIIGSASIKIRDLKPEDGVETVLFSGDIGNYPEDILKSTEMIDKADVVVMESTYGGRVHSTENSTQVITSEINHVEKTGGALLIPSFSIERTQELLHKIDHLKSQGAIAATTQVYLDSPMAVKVTEVYRKYRQLYNKELSEHSQRDDPFDFPGLHITEKYDESMRIHTQSGPKVIIAGSGMMNGGRIVTHAAHYLPQKSTRLLIVGYQGEETLGRKIVEGERQVTIGDKDIMIQAHVSSCTSLSAHADEPRLLQWLKVIKDVKKVILVHGDDQPRKDLAQAIKEKIGIHNIEMPEMNQTLTVTT